MKTGKKGGHTKGEAVEETLEIDGLAGVGKLVEIANGTLGFLNKDIVGILTEGLDGKDLTCVLSLPLPVLLWAWIEERRRGCE